MSKQYSDYLLKVFAISWNMRQENFVPPCSKHQVLSINWKRISCVVSPYINNSADSHLEEKYGYP